MNRAGRVNILLIAAIVVVALVVASIALAKESLETVGARFLTAMAKHDVKTLTDMSYIGETDPVKIEDKRKRLAEEWDFAINKAGKYYSFTWQITASSQPSETSGNVTMQFRRNADRPTSYEEKFELPLLKEGGEWKVDVASISRELFPALPR